MKVPKIHLIKNGNIFIIQNSTDQHNNESRLLFNVLKIHKNSLLLVRFNDFTLVSTQRRIIPRNFEAHEASRTARQGTTCSPKAMPGGLWAEGPRCWRRRVLPARCAQGEAETSELSQ